LIKAKGLTDACLVNWVAMVPLACRKLNRTQRFSSIGATISEVTTWTTWISEVSGYIRSKSEVYQVGCNNEWKMTAILYYQKIELIPLTYW